MEYTLPDTYTLPLPDNLPPTFRGRTLRFSYQFILGICRASPSGPGSSGPASQSRIMKVPIRVYTNVKGPSRHSSPPLPPASTELILDSPQLVAHQRHTISFGQWACGND